jgi:hypothetical protein
MTKLFSYQQGFNRGTSMLVVPNRIWNLKFAHLSPAEIAPMRIPLLVGTDVDLTHTVNPYKVVSRLTKKQTLLNIICGEDEYILTLDASKELGLVTEVVDFLALQS